MVYRPTARVLSVLELLQAHGTMSGVELARRLEVDARTIRRYITTLQDMGIPVEAEFGRDGGYRLRAGYKLPPLMFNEGEALAAIIGLLLARRSGVALDNVAVESAVAKIRRVLPEPLREQASALTATQLDDPPDAPTVSAVVLTTLTTAAERGQRVRLTYVDRHGEATARDFDPYSVIYFGSEWYTVGYCHLRKGLRSFRLERIQHVTESGGSFTPPADFDGLRHLGESIAEIPDTWNVTVLLTSLAPDEAARRLPRGLALLQPTPDGVLMRAAVADLDDLARYLLTLQCEFIVIAPDELRAALRRAAEDALRYARRFAMSDR